MIIRVTERGSKVAEGKDVELFYSNYNHFVDGQIKNNFDYSNICIKSVYEDEL